MKGRRKCGEWESYRAGGSKRAKDSLDMRMCEVHEDKGCKRPKISEEREVTKRGWGGVEKVWEECGRGGGT